MSIRGKALGANGGIPDPSQRREGSGTRSLVLIAYAFIAMSRRAQAKCLKNFCRYLSFVDTSTIPPCTSPLCEWGLAENLPSSNFTGIKKCLRLKPAQTV